MKVAFVSHGSSLRGAERALLELIDGLQVRGVTCFVLLPQRGALAKRLEDRKVPFAIIPYSLWCAGGAFWKRPIRELMTLAALLPVIHQLRRWQVDVVFTNTCTVCVGAFAAAILRKPHVWFVHEFGKADHGLSYDFGIKISSWIMRRLSSFVITNSDAVRDYYMNYISRERLACVAQAVELSQNNNDSEYQEWPRTVGVTRLVLTGGIQEGKGQLDAVRAVDILARKGVQLELYLVGGGGGKRYEQEVRKTVSHARLDDCVFFTGEVGNPNAIMMTADIVLMCSRAEAFGRVTVEAMKLGKPVIGARGGATPELVREDFNGLCYTPGNEVELAEKIFYLIRHPVLAEQMGQNGRKWAETEFNTKKYSEQIHKLMIDAIRKCGKLIPNRAGSQS